MKIGIFLTSKNNYSMLKEWYSLFDYSKFMVLNIDVGSSSESLTEGKNFCNDHGIYFIQSSNSEMQLNFQEAINFFLDHDINWAIYTHQDTFPLHSDFFDILINKYLLYLDPLEVGMLGFNIFHDKADLSRWDDKNRLYMTLARTPLELGDGYYRALPQSRVNYSKFIKNKPFLIEIPMWSTAIVSCPSFQKYIQPDSSFNFFYGVDDLALQFLLRNVPNIALPELCFAHDQSLKLKHKLPYKSPVGNKDKVEAMYGILEEAKSHFKSKWGFRYNVYKTLYGLPILVRRIVLKILNFIYTDNALRTIGRYDFSKVQSKYTNTLLEEFFKHDPSNGPLRYFEINPQSTSKQARS